jgi:hypothetical protein
MCFVHCLYITGTAIFDYTKRLIQLTVVPLSVKRRALYGHILYTVKFELGN